jgi:AcrR family transcriptional regulator
VSARGPDTASAGRARTLATAIHHPPSRGAGRATTKAGEPRSSIREAQRTRLLTAAVGIVAEVGYAQLSVTRVVTRAGVSRGTFYEFFANREELFLEAFEEAVARLGAAVERGYAGEGAWQERVRAGLEAMLGALDEQPALTRLCVVEAPQAGTKVQRRRAEILDGFARIVDEGREGGRDRPRGEGDRPSGGGNRPRGDGDRPSGGGNRPRGEGDRPSGERDRPGGGRDRPGGGPPPLTAQSLVAGAASVVQERLLTPAAGPLAQLAGPLASMIVFPYRGPAAAARELERPARKARRPVKL